MLACELGKRGVAHHDSRQTAAVLPAGLSRRAQVLAALDAGSQMASSNSNTSGRRRATRRSIQAGPSSAASR
jgi:hypothetical protein